MKPSELRVDWLKRELSQLELPTTGTKNELQRRLREQLQLQGIDIEFYEFEERALQASASQNVLAKDVSRAESQKMQEAKKCC